MIHKSIALVDFFHMLTVHFKATAGDAGPNDAGQRTLNDLAAIRSATDHVVVCVDSPPYWRKTVFPGYKQGREREPEFSAIVKWTLERVELDGFQLARAQGEEADDVIATLATAYAADGCEDVRIVGADKDALQLVDDRIRCFVPKGRGEFEIRGADYVRERYGVGPSDFALFLAICGDTSDKIPGIKGIGDKGAAKLINAYKTVEGMASACVGAIDAAKMTDKPAPAFWRNYAAGMAELPKWLQLTTLNREAKLEQPPPFYLARLTPRPIVQAEPSDADDSEFYPSGPEDFGGSDDPDWEAIEKATAERERAELAAALPVSPVVPAADVNPAWPMGEQRSAADRQVAAARALPLEPVRGTDAYDDAYAESEHLDPLKPKPLIGKDPNADQILKDAEAEREREKLERLKAEAHARIASGQTDPATGKVEGFTPPGAKAPKAEPAPLATPAPKCAPEASAPPSAAAAEVVPKTQGPRKVEAIPSPTGAEIVRVPPPNWALATQPSTASEMLAVAKILTNGRFLSHYGTPEGMFTVIAMGRELGMGFMTALEAFHIVQNRPWPKAKALKALAEKHPDCEWIQITSADDKHATIKTMHRKAGPLEYTYTIERAAQAGYLTGANKHNWLTKPQEMLEARAMSKGSNRWYSGATMGLHSAEEMEDGTD